MAKMSSTVLDHKLSSDTRGFSIVEMLIVLTIAGLILSIVFLAIPAIQRNSRNNQRKQDVSAVLNAIAQYELNNSGTFPVDSNASAFTSNVLPKVKLSYYNPADVSTVGVANGSAAPGTTITVSNRDKLYIYNRSKCDSGDDGQPTKKGAGYSDIVAIFAIETSNTYAPKCQEL